MKRCKIGLATPYDLSRPGGVNSHVLALAGELRRRGLEASVIGPASEPRRVDAAGTITVGGAVPLHVAGSVARLDVNPYSLAELMRVLDRERFDILHLHEPFVPMVPFLSLVFADAVKVGTFHLFRERTHRLYQLNAPWLRPLAARLHARIAVSPAALRTVADFLPGEYEVIPNGIDYDRFAGERPGAPRPTILFLGRLEARKGLPDLLEAFALVKQRVPDARLLVGGTGPGRRQAELFVRARQLRDIRFLGHVPEAVKPKLYREADVFCAPSRGNESFGIVLVEALAAGAAVVASGIEGYRSVITDGQNGVLVRPADPVALAGALTGVLLDGELRGRLSRQGRLDARAYDWPRIANRVLALYELAALRAGRPLRLPHDAAASPPGAVRPAAAVGEA